MNLSGPAEALSAQQRLARRDLRFARWMLPLASAGVLIGSGPLVGIPVAYLSASLLLAMTLDAERQRSEGVTLLLFAVGLAASVVARSLTFPVGWSAIVAGVVMQAVILRRTRGRHVPTADAPFWDPNASSVRSLALMPEPDRRPFEPPPTVVVRQRDRRFDPRPASVAGLCWATIAAVVGVALPGLARVVALAVIAVAAAAHLQTYWPWARQVEVAGGRAVLRGRWRTRPIADAAIGGWVVRSRVVLPDGSPPLDVQQWFDANGRQTASFVESAWDAEALDKARLAVRFPLEIEATPVPLLELRRRRSRAFSSPR